MTSYQCKAEERQVPRQECNWPLCGCDPYANRVIEALKKLDKPRTTPPLSDNGE